MHSTSTGWAFLVKLAPDSLTVAVGTTIADGPRGVLASVYEDGSYRGWEFDHGNARFRGTMVSFGESVAELSFAPVVARGSEDVLLVSRQNKYLGSCSPCHEDALNGACF